MPTAYVWHLFDMAQMAQHMYGDDNNMITRTISGLPTKYEYNGCILSVCHLKKRRMVE